ncbi:barstar family protein [Actinoplanes sp. NPDC048796]|uniref:barstar family protein n=1 Tax=unclassified Actinoplanes TaxID=2626549 RepID=UPI0033E2667E
MLVEIKGTDIQTVQDLHRTLAQQLDFGTDGWNMDALRDRLMYDIERPIHLVWNDSEVSRARLGEPTFTAVANIFRETQEQDERYGWGERFTFEMK